MNFLDAMSAIGQGFDTCALNMSRNRFQRSSLYFADIAQWLERKFLELNVVGSSPIICAMLGATNLCVKKLMIKAYKLKTLKSYGLRFIYL